MIRLFWRLLLICLAIAIIAYGTAFSYYNSQESSLDLVFMQLPSLPMGLLILTSLLIGFILAFLVFILPILRLRISNALLKGKLTKQQQDS